MKAPLKLIKELKLQSRPQVFNCATTIYSAHYCSGFSKIQNKGNTDLDGSPVAQIISSFRTSQQFQSDKINSSISCNFHFNRRTSIPAHKFNQVSTNNHQFQQTKAVPSPNYRKTTFLPSNYTQKRIFYTHIQMTSIIHLKNLSNRKIQPKLNMRRQSRRFKLFPENQTGEQ